MICLKGLRHRLDSRLRGNDEKENGSDNRAKKHVIAPKAGIQDS
jgi:ribosomal protein S13